MINLILGTSLAIADPLGTPETSYYGATILSGDNDVIFSDVLDIEYNSSPDTYGFFEGNTLYVGNSDDYGNSVDGIIEFFWFQSSIDRNSDFYVAVVKVRATPGRDCPFWLSLDSDCELWADEWQDFGEHPVISVEAITDVTREQGAFRWDWAVPFENYGIDAYGQVSFTNQYGIGANAEGAILGHGEIPLDESGSIQASGNVQVKGFMNPSFMVQTQFDVTLYEWDVYVNGRADLMSWDMFLNLGQRSDQSAYQEYFLPIQVETGKSFMMDELNFLSTFDTGNINPFAHKLGLSVQNLTISAPFWEPQEEEEEEEDIIEPSEEDVEEDTALLDEEDTALLDEEQSSQDLELDVSEPVKSGCSYINQDNRGILVFLLSIIALMFRKNR